MKNTMNQLENNFKNLYKKAFKEWKQAIKNEDDEEQRKAYDEMDSISTMYVKVVYGITYKTSEENYLTYVSVETFVEREYRFENECEREYYKEYYSEKWGK